MFNASNTTGAIAVTRGSTAPVSRVVQPRFDAPNTVNVVERLVPLATRRLVARIERAHDGFHHRQQQRPFRIAAAQILVEGVRDQAIFGQVEQRLIWHLADDDDDRVQQPRERDERIAALRQILFARRGIGVRLLPAPAADDQQRVVGLVEAARLDQHDLMLPSDALPRLRLQQQLDRVGAFRAVARAQLPAEGVVRLRDVARERARGVGRRSRRRRGRWPRRASGRGRRARRARAPKPSESRDPRRASSAVLWHCRCDIVPVCAGAFAAVHPH